MGFLGRSDARGVFRLLRDVSGGESPFASDAVRWPGGELGSNDRDRAAIDGNLPALSHGRQDRPDRGELPSPDDGDSALAG
jgi:hypothetical protein